MRQRIEVEDHFGAYLVTYPSGETKLVQSDWGYPALARELGWNGKRGRERCPHRGTDGTVKCPDCGMTADQFIVAAAEFIDDYM